MATIRKHTSIKTAKTTYHVKIRLKGHQPLSRSFLRLTDAKRWVESTESDMRRNRYERTRESEKNTFSDMIDRYVKEVLPRNAKRQKDLLPKLLWWKQQLGWCVLADLTKSQIISQRDKLALRKKNDGKQLSPSTVNRYHAALSCVFSIAVDEWEWLGRHPMHRVGKLKEPRGRCYILTREECAGLLKLCKDGHHHLYPVVKIALCSGARWSEILNLKWTDINFASEQAILRETKNGEDRVMVLSSHLMPLLKDLFAKRTASEFAFPSKEGSKPAGPAVRRSWNKAILAANFAGFRFHDLRHTSASHLAMSGASTSQVSEALGHKSATMTKRYVHYTKSNIANIVNNMNDGLFEHEAV